jgi:hypothetical protein
LNALKSLPSLIFPSHQDPGQNVASLDEVFATKWERFRSLLDTVHLSLQPNTNHAQLEKTKVQYQSSVDVLVSQVQGVDRLSSPVVVDRQLFDIVAQQDSLIEVHHLAHRNCADD